MNEPTRCPAYLAIDEINAELLTARRAMNNADTPGDIRKLARVVIALEAEQKMVADVGITQDRMRAGAKRQALASAGNQPSSLRSRDGRGVWR